MHDKDVGRCPPLAVVCNFYLMERGSIRVIESRCDVLKGMERSDKDVPVVAIKIHNADIEYRNTMHVAHTKEKRIVISTALLLSRQTHRPRDKETETERERQGQTNKEKKTNR